MAIKPCRVKEIIELPIDEIKPNPYQQRKYFDFYSLNRLTDSIKKYGVLQPISVRVVNGKSYELVSGDRRLRASRAAGLKTIPAVFVEADEKDSSLLSFIENLQRKNLSYIEEADGYKALMEDFGLTVEKISESIGVSRSVINSRLKMLELPDEAIKLICENSLEEECVRAVLKIPDSSMRIDAINKIIDEGMSVKKAEDYVDKVLFSLRFGENKQKLKTGISDMRLFTNSIKQTVDAVRNSGIPAYYDIVDTDEGLEINIKVVTNGKFT